MTDKVVDYYFATNSPWSYLGHERFVTLAHEHGATINLYPMDLGKVFPVSGGLPLAKRAPQRQAYRLFELARWRDHLGVPINFQPKFAASSGELASKWITAAAEQGSDAALALGGAILRGRWAGERDIADPATLSEFAKDSGLDPAALAARADSAEVAARYLALTQEAIEAQVFGAPWYVYSGEPFWGQDRLDFLDRALAK